jgi:hypothetical protein
MATKTKSKVANNMWSIPAPKLWPPPETVSEVLVYRHGRWHRASLDNFHAPTWDLYGKYHGCYWIAGLPPPPGLS